MQFNEALKWRYATKRMNHTKINNDQLNSIIEAIALAPTSMGMQPFSLLVIEDEATLKAISEDACKQPQVLECSHLLVLATWNTYSEAKIDDYINNIANTRGVAVEGLAGFKTNMMGLSSNLNPEQLKVWAQKQAYIALGFGLAAAAVAQVDSTPMEGFKVDVLDQVLSLEAKGLSSAVLLAVGHRNSEIDPLAKAAKVRRSLSEFVEKI